MRSSVTWQERIEEEKCLEKGNIIDVVGDYAVDIQRAC